MADPASPPSFDAIFAQQPVRRSSSTSTSSFANYTYSALQQHQQFNSDAPLVDEPQSLSEQTRKQQRDPSKDSSNKRYLDMMSGLADGYGVINGRRQESLRKESLPFNPQEDSTLIATAPKRGERNGLGRNGYSSPIGDIMFGPEQIIRNQPQRPSQQPSWGEGRISEQSVHYASVQQPQYSSFQSSGPGAGSTGMDYLPPGTASSMNDTMLSNQVSPYLSHDAASEGRPQQQQQQQQGEWGQEFIGVEQQQQYAQGEAQSNGMEDMLTMGDESPFENELQRVISNTSHPSQYPSRTTSPFPQQSQSNTVPTSTGNHVRTESFPASRSPSPFPPQQASQTEAPNHVVSPPSMGQPTYPRASSSPRTNPNSPFFNKPQSPPALIIPNSPVLPSIVTQSTSNNHSKGLNQSHTRHANNGAGGLFPPSNPALEHLTGMAGISPIAPNADGPMICIQPSTPISGLKEGRGLFDAALRRAGGAQRQGPQGQGESQQDQQQDGFNVPPPQSHPLPRTSSSDQINQDVEMQGMDFAAQMQSYEQQGWASDTLRIAGPSRPRAKSDSIIPSPTADSFDRQAFLAFIGAGNAQPPPSNVEMQPGYVDVSEQWRNTVSAWKAGLGGGELSSQPTLDPRLLPGRESNEAVYQQLLMQQQTGQLPRLDPDQLHQLTQIEAQRARFSLNTNVAPPKYEPGEFSPTSMAFYQSMGLYPHATPEMSGTVSAPWSQTAFGQVPGPGLVGHPATAGPAQQHFLTPTLSHATVRRRSFGGGEHPAMGAGTPGYGMEFSSPFMGKSVGQIRGVNMGHRRAARSEDFGRGGTGWGVGAGGSTAEFLQSITGDDGSLLPPSNRGHAMSHSRHSSTSSIRSASPALSISSQGSSFSHHSPRMDMPDSMYPGHPIIAPATPLQVSGLYEEQQAPARVAKMKVTSVATEVASTSRRTNSGIFKCPVPGCGSTFTRHFNLKGHLRSHNDERPFKCLYEGCPKAIVGFARQHDCKRHMLLHEGLRLFECEGCGKKFARLDALTRHHKSEQGQECAITHPLPTNFDGSPMSESQYKTYKGIKSTPEGSGRRQSSTASGSGSGSGKKRSKKSETSEED